MELAKVVIEDYKDIYPEVKRNEKFICEELSNEGMKFESTLKLGEKLFYKTIKNIKG